MIRKSGYLFFLTLFLLMYGANFAIAEAVEQTTVNKQLSPDVVDKITKQFIDSVKNNLDKTERNVAAGVPFPMNNELSGQVVEGLGLKLRPLKASYAVNEPITAVLELHNTSQKIIYLPIEKWPRLRFSAHLTLAYSGEGGRETSVQGSLPLQSGETIISEIKPGEVVELDLTGSRTVLFRSSIPIKNLGIRAYLSIGQIKLATEKFYVPEGYTGWVGSVYSNIATVEII